jgi:hypothetical protein
MAWSAVDDGHVRLVVALACGRCEVVQPFGLLGAELDAVGGCGLLDSGNPCGAGDRRDVVAPVAVVAELRGDITTPYDVAVGLPLGTDPMPYAEAGATWWMPDLAPDTLSLGQVRGVIRDGPAPAP